MLEVAGGNKDELGDAQGWCLPTGSRMPAGSLPEKLGCWVTPGEGRRVGPWRTLTQIVSSLVRKLGCVKTWLLVKNSRLKQEDFTQKKAFSHYLRNSCEVAGSHGSGVVWLQACMAAGYWRGRRQQGIWSVQRRSAGLREIAVPRET